jgi:hypothetical protein
MLALLVLMSSTAGSPPRGPPRIGDDVGEHFLQLAHVRNLDVGQMSPQPVATLAGH